jgi:hypothetical protein
LVFTIINLHKNTPHQEALPQGARELSLP